MSWMRGMLAALVGCGTFVVLAWVGAVPAAASCVPTPVVSVYRFAGTVTATEHDGRIATVRTDDGREVRVEGNDSAGPVLSTSVDRTYLVGERYEFHPVNATSPYRDNICTATHVIGPAAAAEPSQKAAPPAPPVAGPRTGDPSGARWPAVAGAAGLAALAVLAVGLVWWRRRAARRAVTE